MSSQALRIWYVLYLRTLLGSVRYYQIAYIDSDDHTHYAYAGNSTLIERLGLCELQKNTLLSE